MKICSTIVLISVLLTPNLYAHGDICPPGMKPFHEYRLFFGRNHDDTGVQTVSHTDWEQFVEQEITPRFPEGLTVVDTRGQFKNDSDTIVKENTKMVILLVPLDITGVNSSMSLIDEIMQAYGRKFQRKFFLRTHNFTCVQVGYTANEVKTTTD